MSCNPQTSYYSQYYNRDCIFLGMIASLECIELHTLFVSSLPIFSFNSYHEIRFWSNSEYLTVGIHFSLLLFFYFVLFLWFSKYNKTDLTFTLVFQYYELIVVSIYLFAAFTYTFGNYSDFFHFFHWFCFDFSLWILDSHHYFAYSRRCSAICFVSLSGKQSSKKQHVEINTSFCKSSAVEKFWVVGHWSEALIDLNLK